AEFHALLLFLQGSLFGVFVSFDLLSFYVFFELTLLPLLFLIGGWGGTQREFAVRKFFIYTLAGSLVGLVGLLTLVVAVHARHPEMATASIPQLAEIMRAELNAAAVPGAPFVEGDDARAYWTSVQTFAFACLFLAFAVKLPMLPFHTWVPLTYVSSPYPVTVVLATTLSKLGAYGFVRLCLPLTPLGCETYALPFLGALSAAAVVYGGFCALAQTDVKRLFAYSSISHLGFCTLGFFALNVEGIGGGVLQMFSHGLSVGGLFLVLGMLHERFRTQQMSEFGGVTSRLPLLGGFMLFFCLSSLALPLLNGFVGEVTTLAGMFRVRPMIAAVAGLGMILTAWYLLHMIQKVFHGPLHLPKHDGELRDLSPREVGVLLPVALACVIVGVTPNLVLDTIRPEVHSLASLFDPNRANPAVAVETAATNLAAPAALVQNTLRESR
ncbi:MAG: complex I subunit 4 family protein, partial [Planctomycetia bacterium]